MKGIWKKIQYKNFNKNREVLLDLIPVKYFSKVDTIRILDTGMGNGKLAIALAKKFYKTHKVIVYGMELDEVMIKRSMKHKLKNVQIKPLRHDLNERFPFKKDFFDIVLSNQTIEHLYHTDDYIKEVHRVLNRRGFLLLATVNLATLHYRFMLLLGQLPIVLHPSQISFGNFMKGSKNIRYCHKSVFTYPALKQFLDHYGFKTKGVFEKVFTRNLYFCPSFISKLILHLFPNFGTHINCIVRKK